MCSRVCVFLYLKEVKDADRWARTMKKDRPSTGQKREENTFEVSEHLSEPKSRLVGT